MEARLEIAEASQPGKHFINAASRDSKLFDLHASPTSKLYPSSTRVVLLQHQCSLLPRFPLPTHLNAKQCRVQSPLLVAVKQGI